MEKLSKLISQENKFRQPIQHSQSPLPPPTSFLSLLSIRSSTLASSCSIGRGEETAAGLAVVGVSFKCSFVRISRQFIIILRLGRRRCPRPPPSTGRVQFNY